jgi:hypothetical protein
MHSVEGSTFAHVLYPLVHPLAWSAAAAVTERTVTLLTLSCVQRFVLTCELVAHLPALFSASNFLVHLQAIVKCLVP